MTHVHGDFNAGAGRFATARRGGIDHDEFLKIKALCAEGVSPQTIAFVLGRPVCDVQLVAACFPRAMRKAFSPPGAIPPPKPPVVFTAGGEAPRSPYRRIAAEVAMAHGLSVADLRGPSVVRYIARARQEAFWRLRNETTISQPAIGKWFGDRDHTTVLWGVRKHQERLDAAMAEAAAE